MAPAIEVRRLGVRYSLRLNRHNTVRDSILTAARRASAPGHFWALRDVSFSVDPRESLAVIGPNGAGKSTLLQVLAGILEPTEGWVRVSGRVTSMLTVGVGFDPDLTGRDNILLAGAFMGLDHRQTMSKLDEIIEFAGLGPFIDAKIKTYSSGMNARLGFSIATALDPDVLVIDEVLGAGDATFRSKSEARIKELMRAARAIVLVTHDMHWPVEFCNRAILLEQGQVVAAGDPAEVVKLHQDRSDQRRQGIQPEPLEPVIDSGLGAGHFASNPASGS